MPGLKGQLEPEHRLSDVVYERIGEAIIAGRLEPGARIRDVEIAAELGVSRMPMREALQRLERIGLVEMSASRFTRVTDISPEQIDAALEYLGYEVGIALHMAVPRMDDEERARAVQLALAVSATCGALPNTDSMTDIAPDDVESIYDALNALYDHIAASSGNEVFHRAYTEAWFGLAGHSRASSGSSRRRVRSARRSASSLTRSPPATPPSTSASSGRSSGSSARRIRIRSPTRLEPIGSGAVSEERDPEVRVVHEHAVHPAVADDRPLGFAVAESRLATEGRGTRPRGMRSRGGTSR